MAVATAVQNATLLVPDEGAVVWYAVRAMVRHAPGVRLTTRKPAPGADIVATMEAKPGVDIRDVFREALLRAGHRVVMGTARGRSRTRRGR